MSNVEIIDLLDDSQTDEVIFLDDDEENKMQEFLEYQHLSVLYQTCLNKSSSKGIKRIFKRMIIPAYKDMDKSYSESEKFYKLLSNTIQLIKNDSIHIYSHIKGFYEILKLHKYRKKVDFVTLATNLNGEGTKEGIKRTHEHLHNNKKAKADVFNLDNDESVLYIDNGPDLNDVVCIDEKNTETGNADSPQAKSILSNSTNLITNHDLNQTITKSSNENTVLLTPSTVCNSKVDEAHKLELLMEKYRKKILQLEQREVVSDKGTSPYIQSEKYKSALVELYGRWCELMGTESVRSKKITLKVQEGHPPGPIRRLETFLNNNTGRDGCPMFPDLNNVFECVLASNREDGLSWNKARVMSEAIALFTQCGRALQKRRQKQEWHHLMSLVNQDGLKDPAEDDPELEARLQRNKHLANIKEAKILEKFSLMQDLPTKEINGESSQLTQENPNSINCLDDEDITDVLSNIKVEVKQEFVDVVKQLEELGDNYTTVVQDIQDPFLVVEISDSSDEEKGCEH